MTEIISKCNYHLNSNYYKLGYPVATETSTGSLYDSSESDIEYNTEIDGNLTKLTNMVRMQYLSYVQKMLKDNYEKWSVKQYGFKNDDYSEEWMKNCVLKHEQKAIKACMISQIYRKAMLKIISEIRRETECGKLDKSLQEPLNFNDATTQTDDLNSFHQITNTQINSYLTLDERIRSLQENFVQQRDEIKSFHKPHKSKRKHASKNSLISSYYHHKQNKIRKSDINGISTTTTTVTSLEPVQANIISPQLSSVNADSSVISPSDKNHNTDDEDEIAKKLETICGEPNTIEDEIFGDDSYNPEIEKILKEIKEAKLPPTNLQTESTEKIDYNNDLNIPSVPIEKPQQVASVSSVISSSTIELRNSLWPCELHMQQQKLRNILGDLSEKGLRCYERVRYRFIELFGEESEDELTIYSPSIEINEVVLESCKKRIAPWIVKYLMIPMSDGLIGNRFIFKKLAKKLAHLIITENQYPDENLIKRVVENLFCYKKAINSIKDIEEIILYNIDSILTYD